MLLTTLIIFILTACGGLFLLTYVLRNKNTPKGIALIHGSLGAIGIILLAINFYYYPWLLAFFVLVALGGAFLFYKDLSGQNVPKILALGHGLLALLAIVLFATAIFHP